MKNKRQIALNKWFNFLIITGGLLIWFSICFFKDKMLGWGIGVAIAALLCIFGGLTFTPAFYSFDKDGVSFCYVFLPTERYLWKNIRAIEVNWISSGKASFWEFLYASVFSIRGINEGEHRFYMEGNIRKSFRTKHLLEKHWDGTITGYFFEDVKKSIKKHKDKKNTQIKVHLADEIKPIEREIRTKSRAWLEPFIAEAKLHNLELKARYLYITEDFNEYKSRPDDGYTYTIIIEIARPNETNEDYIIVEGIDLIYVRLGKTAYKGVLNEHAEEELKLILRETLDEIYQNGIEVYCDNN